MISHVTLLRNKGQYSSLQEAVKVKILEHGGLRSLARRLRISPSYVSRMATGKRVEPTDEMLEKLGLVRKVVYVDQKSV